MRREGVGRLVSLRIGALLMAAGAVLALSIQDILAALSVGA